VREFPKTAGWKFVVGGFSSAMNQPCPLKQLDRDPYGYDLWIIGTPVWAWRPAPPLLTFLKQNPPDNIQVAAFVTHQGSEGKSVEKLKSLCSKGKVLTTNAFHTSEDHRENLAEEIKKWIIEIQKSGDSQK
jgi:flavodoxin